MNLTVNKSHRHRKDYRQYKTWDISKPTETDKAISRITNDPDLSREEKIAKIREYLKTEGR